MGDLRKYVPTPIPAGQPDAGRPAPGGEWHLVIGTESAGDDLRITTKCGEEFHDSLVLGANRPVESSEVPGGKRCSKCGLPAYEPELSVEDQLRAEIAELKAAAKTH